MSKTGREKWVKMGVVGVDSGQLMIMDPCYVDSEWKKDDGSGEYGGGTYEQCCKVTSSKKHGGQLKYELGHDGLGVAFATGLGDGTYEVWARIGKYKDLGERVKEVVIKLLP